MRLVKRVVPIDKVDLIHKFVQAYNSAQDSIEENRIPEAKQKYHELMSIYKDIADSDVESVHKELAYDQVMKVYQGVKGMKVRKTINTKAVALAIVLIIISLVIFIKPEIIGLATFEFNHAPEWSSGTNVFVILGIQGNAQFDEYYDRTIDLNAFFSDSDNDELAYLATSAPGLKVQLNGNFLTFLPEPGVFGKRAVTIVASDGQAVTKQEMIVDIIK